MRERWPTKVAAIILVHWNGLFIIIYLINSRWNLHAMHMYTYHILSEASAILLSSLLLVSRLP